MINVANAYAEFMEAKRQYKDVLETALLELEGNAPLIDSVDGDFTFNGLGSNIIHLRKTNGFTQSQLAEMVGVGKSMMCQIEKGTKIPSLGVALSIAKALGCTVDELCREESA